MTTARCERKFMTADEKVFLTEIIDRYKDIIESKKTDCVNISQKNKTWVIITKEFNSIPENTCRSTQQLRKAWDNIKSRRRKELSEEKKQRMATGGGVYKPSNVEDSVDGILNSVDIELKDTIDSDTFVLTSDNYILNEDNVLEPIQNYDVDLNKSDSCSSKISTRESIAICKKPDTVPESENNKQKSILKKRTFTSKGSAVEKELEVRLERNKILLEQDAEIHNLRVEEHKLRVEEQRLRVAEQAMKNKITELQLKQAMQFDEGRNK